MANALSVAELKFFSPESEICLQRLEVHEKVRNVFVMSLRLSDHQVLHNIASSSRFLDFARIFLLFSLLPRTSKLLWRLRNLIKQLFHSRLLDMRLAIANLALRASVAIYHLISNARSWNNC